jgi:hypothetical protein
MNLLELILFLLGVTPQGDVGGDEPPIPPKPR